MGKRFSTTVSMFCTQSEFDKYLRSSLLEMGYEILHSFEWSENPNQKVGVVTNFSNRIGIVGPVPMSDVENHGRILIKSFNPTLFLALAAMSNVEYGVPGEYWTFMEEDGHPDGSFTHGKIYEAHTEIDITGAFTDNKGGRNGYSLSPFKHFRKSTVEEITKGLGETVVLKQESFPVTRDQMKDIYAIACSTWKEKISIKMRDLNLHIEDAAEIDVTFVKEMFDGAKGSTTQTLLLAKIFPSYEEKKKDTLKSNIDERRGEIDRHLQTLSSLITNDSFAIQVANSWARKVGMHDLDNKCIGINTKEFDVVVHEFPSDHLMLLEFKEKA